MANINIATYTRLRFWVQLALPAVYEDSLSYVEQIKRIWDTHEMNPKDETMTKQNDFKSSFFIASNI